MGEGTAEGRSEIRSHRALLGCGKQNYLWKVIFLFCFLLPLTLSYSQLLKLITVNHRKRMSQVNSSGQFIYTMPNVINFLRSN